MIHTHAPFATSLACLGADLPPFHYMIAVAGGRTIRCAPYALFGTQVAVLADMFGLLLELAGRWSPWTTPRSGASLQTEGLYAHVRHPVYLTGFVESLGLALTCPP